MKCEVFIDAFIQFKAFLIVKLVSAGGFNVVVYGCLCELGHALCGARLRAALHVKLPLH